MPEQKSVDNLLFYDPDFETYTEGFLKEYPSSSVTRSIGNTNDLIEAVKEYKNVKNVELVLHGSPGNLWFKSKGQMVGSYFGTIAKAANMLAPNARVLFLGCNIADGSDGDKFLTDVGKNMFTGIGGIAGGTTVANAVFRGGITRMNPLRFFDAKLKVRRFDLSGRMISGQDVGYFGGTTQVPMTQHF
jgi:hypothetical protein